MWTKNYSALVFFMLAILKNVLNYSFKKIFRKELFLEHFNISYQCKKKFWCNCGVTTLKLVYKIAKVELGTKTVHI